jgi:hypothetical protein
LCSSSWRHFYRSRWRHGGAEGSVLCFALMVVIWFVFARMFPAVKYPDPAALGNEMLRRDAPH